MRLIDADALLGMGRARKIIEVVGNWQELPGCAKSACVRLGVAHKKMILDAPTVDAVKVVRCKDCKHYLFDDFDGCYVCMQLSKYVKTDFWCAYGERKEHG